MKEKFIGGVSLSDWKKIFSFTGKNKDYLEDILFFKIYEKEINTEIEKINEEDEDAICDIYNAKLEYAYKAYKEIFGIDYI